MPDLAGRGLLGPKAFKPEKKPHKPIRKISPKKARHKAAERALGAWEHMAAVKALPCITCQAPPPSEAHHVRDDDKPRSDLRVIPLCPSCHTGPFSHHKAHKAWRDMYGRDCDMLDRVAAKLNRPAAE